MEVLDSIPFALNLDELLGRAHIEPGSEDAADFANLAEQARTQARPKALYREYYIEAKGEETVTIEGVTFTSRALRSNLDKAERLFAYVATCGREVERITVPDGDFLKRFWMDTIKVALLGASRSYLASHLNRRYALGRTATMSPGSGDATVWPIQQQRQLFSLFGDAPARIGVELTESFLMVPVKSISGIRFPTEIDFRSCQLCHRETCPSRSAPFDPELWDALNHGA